MVWHVQRKGEHFAVPIQNAATNGIAVTTGNNVGLVLSTFLSKQLCANHCTGSRFTDAARNVAGQRVGYVLAGRADYVTPVFQCNQVLIAQFCKVGSKFKIVYQFFAKQSVFQLALRKRYGCIFNQIA